MRETTRRGNCQRREMCSIHDPLTNTFFYAPFGKQILRICLAKTAPHRGRKRICSSSRMQNPDRQPCRGQMQEISHTPTMHASCLLLPASLEKVWHHAAVVQAVAEHLNELWNWFVTSPLFEDDNSTPALGSCCIVWDLFARFVYDVFR